MAEDGLFFRRVATVLRVRHPHIAIVVLIVPSAQCHVATFEQLADHSCAPLPLLALTVAGRIVLRGDGNTARPYRTAAIPSCRFVSRRISPMMGNALIERPRQRW